MAIGSSHIQYACIKCRRMGLSVEDCSTFHLAPSSQFPEWHFVWSIVRWRGSKRFRQISKDIWNTATTKIMFPSQTNPRSVNIKRLQLIVMVCVMLWRVQHACMPSLLHNIDYWHASIGISGLISDHPEVPSVIDYTDEVDETRTSCNKDTGTRKRSKSGPEAIFLLCGVVATSRLGSPCTSECHKAMSYNN